MNVLSLFDGISCARVALDRAGIEVNAYMSSEIDKHAIKISEKNYPDIIRVGSVIDLKVEGQVDLLIGGSPCTDLSIAKKNRKGLEGSQSSLFWEYVRIKKECNPKWFVLENVASMPKADRDIITREMGVEPVMFNASLVSAQSRKRLFWTNIPFALPADRGILLKDILEAEVGEEFYFNREMRANGKTTGKVGHIGKTDSQCNRVYDTNGKSCTLSALGGGLGVKTGLYKIGGRDVILNESPLQVLQEGRTELGKQSRKEIKKQTGKDSTSRSGDHKAYYGKDGTKANCLTTAPGAEGLIVKPDCIRKLTPIECERLQGLPDNYTEGVATTNRYKCLGNAFNCDVVAHIIRGVLKSENAPS